MKARPGQNGKTAILPQNTQKAGGLEAPYSKVGGDTILSGVLRKGLGSLLRVSNESNPIPRAGDRVDSLGEYPSSLSPLKHEFYSTPGTPVLQVAKALAMCRDPKSRLGLRAAVMTRGLRHP